MTKKRMLIVPIQVNQLGCPERCIFCDQNRISGKQGGLPSAGAIEKTIKEHLESWKGEGEREVAFYGGSFTALEKSLQARLLGAALPFVKSGEIDAVRVSTRPDAIDEDVLTHLSEYGVKTIELGVQSMDADVLKRSGRRHRPDDVEHAARLIKASSMRLGCQLMPGLPGDDRDKSVKSAAIVAFLGADIARIYPALVIKGTAMEELYRSGDYYPLGLEEAVSISADMMEVFEESGVDVIRLGLQHEESLVRAIVAGPYHPSFGELVKSERLFRRATKLLADMPDGKKEFTFCMSPFDESAFRGLKNSNLKRLKKAFPCRTIEVSRDTNMERGGLYVG